MASNIQKKKVSTSFKQIQIDSSIGNERQRAIFIKQVIGTHSA